MSAVSTARWVDRGAQTITSRQNSSHDADGTPHRGRDWLRCHCCVANPITMPGHALRRRCWPLAARVAPEDGQERSTSLVPTGFSRGHAIRVGHLHTDSPRSNANATWTPRACRVADACGTYRAVQSRKSSVAIHPRVFRASRSGCVELAQGFEPRSGCRRELATRRAGIRQSMSELDFPACGVATATRYAIGVIAR